MFLTKLQQFVYMVLLLLLYLQLWAIYFLFLEILLMKERQKDHFKSINIPQVR